MDRERQRRPRSDDRRRREMERTVRTAIDPAAEWHAVLMRRGVTLVEVLVALTLGGVVLAAAGGSMLRQQRAARWVEGLNGAELQSRPALRALPDALSQLDAGSGDIAAGQASDSTLQIRSVVATSLTCDTATANVTLLPSSVSALPLGGEARMPAAGDSLWLFAGDSAGWRARRVVASSRVTAGCAYPTMPAGSALRLTVDAPAGVGGATPVRITRWERWVVYRASDGGAYLGIRDWSTATARWLSPQPVAGPFVRSLPTGERTGFRYFDASGAPLDPDGTNERSIARVRVTALSSAGQGTSSRTVRRDSADAVLARRGGP
jgi:prepilin-type N-terminal cleavage/methylation domain-containing protein